MKSLITRSLSGIVYVALIVGAILAGEFLFAMITALFSILGIYELNRNFVSSSDTWAGRFSMLFTMAVTLILFLLIGIEFIAKFAPIIFLLLIALPVAIFTLAVFNKGGNALKSALVNVFSVIYVAFPLFLLNGIYQIRFCHTQGMIMALMAFILIWVNDTGAFCVGCTIGRHKMCSRLSPKKSMEGLFGGMAFCIAAAIGASFIVNSGLSMLQWAVIGLLVSVFATLGDLFESLIKRTLGVKDSGNLIPGHGGILDRIDSLLFVAPALLICLTLFTLYN